MRHGAGRGSAHKEEHGADVRVDCKLELEIVQSRVGRPSALVIPGDAHLVVDLWLRSSNRSV